MAASSCAHTMSCTLQWRSQRLQLVCGCVLAALSELNIDAVRLDLGAISSEDETDAGLVSSASALLAPDGAATRAQRERDLRAAAAYIDSIGVQDYLHLGNIRDILERFEDIKERVTSFKVARDPRHRLQIRQILRDVTEQGKVLNVMAGELQAEGEVDDGGGDPPTQRDNICNHISEYGVEMDFRELVLRFCEYLDTVRQAVTAGEDEEPMAYSVSGLLSAITTNQNYRQGPIGWEIERVLGEERRWVAKHLAPWPGATGNSSPSLAGAKTRFRRWALRAWETQIWEDVGVDAAALPFNALKNAQDELVSATVDDDPTLSSVLTRIQRLEFCKSRLAPFISRSDPSFRERLRDVFQNIKARMDLLRALAARQVAAGEVDSSGKLLPSQRDNICTKLEDSALDENFREDVRRLCETFDRLHLIAKIQLEKDKVIYEALGRMVAIGRRPGYVDTPVATELDNLLAEELRWLEKPEAASGT